MGTAIPSACALSQIFVQFVACLDPGPIVSLPRTTMTTLTTFVPSHSDITQFDVPHRTSCCLKSCFFSVSPLERQKLLVLLSVTAHCCNIHAC